MDFSQGHMASKAEAMQVFQAEEKLCIKGWKEESTAHVILLHVILLGQTIR